MADEAMSAEAATVKDFMFQEFWLRDIASEIVLRCTKNNEIAEFAVASIIVF